LRHVPTGDYVEDADGNAQVPDEQHAEGGPQEQGMWGDPNAVGLQAVRALVHAKTLNPKCDKRMPLLSILPEWTITSHQTPLGFG